MFFSVNFWKEIPYGYLTIFNLAMEKSTIFQFGKPLIFHITISHGYVK